MEALNHGSTKKGEILDRFIVGLNKNPISTPFQEVVWLLINNSEAFEKAISELLEKGNGSIRDADLKVFIHQDKFSFFEKIAKQKKMSIEIFFLYLIFFAGFTPNLMTLNGREQLVYNPRRLFS